MIEEISNRMAKQKANAIDQHFFKFLAENGVTESHDAKEIAQALDKAKLEVTSEIEQTLTQEIYTCKLVRVIAETSFNVPTPKITINYDN